MIDRDGEVQRIERDARALPNQITGPNAGGRCQFPIRIHWPPASVNSIVCQ